MDGIEIGRRIRNARIDSGLGVADLARAAGVSRTTLWAWESGQITKQRGPELKRVATVVDLSIEELLRPGTWANE